MCKTQSKRLHLRKQNLPQRQHGPFFPYNALKAAFAHRLIIRSTIKKRPIKGARKEIPLILFALQSALKGEKGYTNAVVSLKALIIIAEQLNYITQLRKNQY